jgi:hypothetical protein
MLFLVCIASSCLKEIAHRIADERSKDSQRLIMIGKRLMGISISRLLVLLVGAQGVGGGPLVWIVMSVGQLARCCTSRGYERCIGSWFGSSGMNVLSIYNTEPARKLSIGIDMLSVPTL